MSNPLQKPLNEIADRIRRAQPTLVRKMGATALYFINENFEKQGFQGESFDKWEPRKSDRDPARPILIGKGTGHLRRSPFISYSDSEKAVITSSLPYSRIHNEGGDISQGQRTAILNFTAHEGKLHLGRVRTIGQQRKITELRRATVGAHTTHMPQRRFMGPSPILDARIRTMLTQETIQLFKIIG